MSNFLARDETRHGRPLSFLHEFTLQMSGKAREPRAYVSNLFVGKQRFTVTTNISYEIIQLGTHTKRINNCQ